MKKTIQKQLFWLFPLLITFISLNAHDRKNTQDSCDGVYTVEPTEGPNGTIAIEVDGNQIVDDNVREILIPHGEYDIARFRNLRGEEGCEFKINAHGGLVQFNGGHGSTFVIENCSFVEVNGKVEGEPYNIGIQGAIEGQQGVAVYGESSNIKIHDLKIFNPIGFAGIMVKNSPFCIGGTTITGHCGELGDNGEIYIHDIFIYDNYIEHIKGEGIYVGDTKFLSSYCCNDMLYYRQRIENIHIHHNIIKNTRLDAIQLGSCTSGGSIHHNTILNYGLDNEGGQSNGIQIGVGTQGAECYNNFIFRSHPESVGHGILSQGAGNNCIYNNIIYRSAENGIYVNESTFYKVEVNLGSCQPYPYKGQIPSRIIHNTIVFPGYSNSNVNNPPAGIRLAYTTGEGSAHELKTDIFGHSLEKNLVVPRSKVTAIEFDNKLLPFVDCMMENLLRGGLIDLSSIFTYGNGMDVSAEWFIPQLSEDEIINAASADYCSKGCPVTHDFFGISRLENGAPDFGAIERELEGSKPKPDSRKN